MIREKLVGEGMVLQPGGGRQKIQCPRCQHQRRNHLQDTPLSVDVDLGVWYCHHCQWTGSVKSRPHYPEPKVALKSSLPPWGEAFFSARKIDIKVALQLKVGSSLIFMGQTEGVQEVLAFPCFFHGQLANVKYRSQDKGFRQVKGGGRIPFNLEGVLGSEAWIWTEGEMDVLALASVGLHALSVPDGAPGVGNGSLEGKMKWLANIAQETAQAGRHILAMDNDPPGLRMEQALASRLGFERCWRVRWPAGCKDANDVLMAHGPEKLRQCVAQAHPFPVPGLVRCRELSTEILRSQTLNTKAGCPLGLSVLDQLYRPRLGEMTIVTGMPGAGKSEFIDQVVILLAQRHQWRFALFSPENRPFVIHFQKLAEKMTGRPRHDISPETLEKEVIPWLDHHFILVDGAEEATNLEMILNRVRTCITRFGVQGMVIDPWNEIDHARPKEITETEHVSRCLSLLRRFCRENQVHLWLVAHPMKMERRSSQGYPVARPYDISGSAHFFNKADNCLSIWRDTASNRVEVHVQKIRFREVGRLGFCLLDYDPQSGLYHQSPIQERISN